MEKTMLLYGLPLTACISLVYCASRFELPSRILQSSLSMFLKTLIGMAALYAVLWYASR